MQKRFKFITKAYLEILTLKPIPKIIKISFNTTYPYLVVLFINSINIYH